MDHNEYVRVWDLPVRVFHWSLVASFVVAYMTSEDENIWHIYSGYAVLGLITFRVLWGFLGTKNARFRNFLFSPAVVVAYLRGMATGDSRRYLGHNPAGGWMIVALLSGLFVISISGLKLYALEEGKGPLAGNSYLISVAKADDDEKESESIEHGVGHRLTGRDSEAEELWEELHEISTNITLTLIALHIAGVFVSGRLHRENLVKAMITGVKRRESS